MCGIFSFKINYNVNKQVYKFQYPNIYQIIILFIQGTASKVVRLNLMVYMRV